jgi:hypothetical protein
VPGLQVCPTIPSFSKMYINTVPLPIMSNLLSLPLSLLV